MNLYGLFILDVNIKYIVFSILYRHINVPVACKELTSALNLKLLATFKLCSYTQFQGSDCSYSYCSLIIQGCLLPQCEGSCMRLNETIASLKSSY